jgi:hypothetical protein
MVWGATSAEGGTVMGFAEPLQNLAADALRLGCIWGDITGKPETAIAIKLAILLPYP